MYLQLEWRRPQADAQFPPTVPFIVFRFKSHPKRNRARQGSHCPPLLPIRRPPQRRLPLTRPPLPEFNNNSSDPSSPDTPTSARSALNDLPTLTPAAFTELDWRRQKRASAPRVLNPRWLSSTHRTGSDLSFSRLSRGTETETEKAPPPTWASPSPTSSPSPRRGSRYLCEDGSNHIERGVPIA
jgi:hypothetical protein